MAHSYESDPLITKFIARLLATTAFIEFWAVEAVVPSAPISSI
jgi:hypothetical protein